MATCLDLATKLIQEFESCKLVAYPDPGTHAEPWTVGWGSTGHDINKTTKWTQEYADMRLQHRIKLIYCKIIKVAPKLTNHQLAAAISFAYNCGNGALLGSTWFRKIKQGNVKEAQRTILFWNKSGGHVMRGLTRRRKAEAAMLDK